MPCRCRTHTSTASRFSRPTCPPRRLRTSRPKRSDRWSPTRTPSRITRTWSRSSAATSPPPVTTTSANSCSASTSSSTVSSASSLGVSPPALEQLFEPADQQVHRELERGIAVRRAAQDVGRGDDAGELLRRQSQEASAHLAHARVLLLRRCPQRGAPGFEQDEPEHGAFEISLDERGLVVAKASGHE